MLRDLRRRFDGANIRRFLRKSKASLKKHGRLPPSRDLGKRQREIKKFVSRANLDGHELTELLSALLDGKDRWHSKVRHRWPVIVEL